ncbi:MAG: phosphoribosylglycinamide formyltransferase [Candidatus Stahlbacteria bacterium]|nr:phosphoribosylglycinamide formyltransferase [Candidatus Stahlbacteria bacterium]
MPKKLIIGVLASGQGSNLQAIIDNVRQGKLNAKIGCVISDNPAAVALERAKEANIPAYYIYPGEYKTKLSPEQEIAYVKCLKEYKIELICLAGFMRILHSHFLQTFKGRVINIHPALLPSFPGLHAQEQAFNYGVKVSGATVHFVDEEVDTGPIIIQKTVKVKENDTPELLAKRILKVEHQIYFQAIQLFAEGRIKIEGRKAKIVVRNKE